MTKRIKKKPGPKPRPKGKWRKKWSSKSHATYKRFRPSQRKYPLKEKMIQCAKELNKILAPQPYIKVTNVKRKDLGEEIREIGFAVVMTDPLSAVSWEVLAFLKTGPATKDGKPLKTPRKERKDSIIGIVIEELKKSPRTVDQLVETVHRRRPEKNYESLEKVIKVYLTSYFKKVGYTLDVIPKQYVLVERKLNAAEEVGLE